MLSNANHRRKRNSPEQSPRSKCSGSLACVAAKVQVLRLSRLYCGLPKTKPLGVRTEAPVATNLVIGIEKR